MSKWVLINDNDPGGRLARAIYENNRAPYWKDWEETTATERDSCYALAYQLLKAIAEMRETCA